MYLTLDKLTGAGMRIKIPLVVLLMISDTRAIDMSINPQVYSGVMLVSPSIKFTSSVYLLCGKRFPGKPRMLYPDRIGISVKRVPRRIPGIHPLPYRARAANPEMSRCFGIRIPKDGIRTCHISDHDMYHENTRGITTAIVVNPGRQ
jgi:hypothetical protein